MKRLLATALAVAVAWPAASAWADPGHGKGHGKGHSWGYGDAPPGLARKPYRMPPGQARKAWARGEHLPAAYIAPGYYVSDPYRYDLPPAPYGHRWVRVHDEFYLADTTSGLIANVVAALIR